MRHGDLSPYLALLPSDVIITWVVAEPQTLIFLFTVYNDGWLYESAYPQGHMQDMLECT